MQRYAMHTNKRLNKNQAIQKLRQYCRYQERSPGDVRGKLEKLGIEETDQDELITVLIDKGWLDEQRFATTYAGGKFRVNKWGRIKIKNELRKKRVGENFIKIALQEIDPAAYSKTLQKLYEQKTKSLPTAMDKFVKFRRTRDYLLQKGYEMNQIARLFNSR